MEKLMDGRSNVGIKKAEKVLCMVLAMLMAIVITINVSAGESISKAKIDEYLYTIAYSQQEQVKEPIYGSIDGEWNIIGLARYGAVTKDNGMMRTNLSAQDITPAMGMGWNIGNSLEQTGAGSIETMTDAEKAAEVEKILGNLKGASSLTLADEASVKAARKAYDGLSADQKKLIPAEKLKALTAAEAKIEQLKKVKTPVVLVINKIDMVKKEEILTFIDAYRKEYDFAEIVPVSARSGDNTDELIKVILKYLPYGPQFYDEDTVTDQPERQIVAELIREKALHCLNEEIPHGIAVAIDRMKAERRVMHIDATIICERDSHKGIIIGKQGSMLKKIGSTARYEIERLLGCKVNLKLWVKVQKNWRDSDYLMKNFGYREDE